MDSKLVVEQMAGRWQVKHPDMRTRRRAAAEVVRQLPEVTFRHVPRERNGHADRLANEAMDAAARGESWVPTGTRSPAPANAPARGWGSSTGAPTVTLLLRHGSTALTVERRFSGVGDPPLSDRGRAEAQAAADRLASSTAEVVVSSPLRRARETAELVAGRLGLEVAVEAAFRETDFGDWEGCTLEEVRQRWPAELANWQADYRVAPPGGESFAATTRRVRAGLDRLLAAHSRRTVVVVAHVTPIKTAVRLALEAPPGALFRMHLDPCALSVVDWYAEQPIVRVLNDTAHLTGRVPA